MLIIEIPFSSSSSATTLTVPVPFYEEPQSELYISPKGAISFGKPLGDTVEDLEGKHHKAVAVLYAGAVNGLVYYRTEPHDSELSSRLASIVQRTYSDATDFKPKVVIIVTWDRIITSDPTAGENQFQLAILSDARKSYALLKFGKIEWVKTSDGIYAQSGFYFSDGRSQKNVNAGKEQFKDLTTMTNMNEDGSFLFRISGSHPVDPREGGPNDDYDYAKNEEEYDADVNADEDDVPGVCPPDPYKDKCPKECQVINDDRGCSLCVCASNPKTNDIGDEEVGDVVELPQNEPIDEGFAGDNQQQRPYEPLPAEQHQPQHPVAAGEYQQGNAIPEYHPQQQPQEYHPQAPRDDQQYSNPQLAPAELQPQPPLKDGTCADVQAHPVPSCHRFASCQDYSGGFCCQCSGDYIGNGIDCVKYNESQRINGFFEGAINGKAIPKTELYTFAQPKDGQQHTALAKVPSHLGTSLLLLDPIGNVMGWLFARRDFDNAYNGFELTGGIFNRTVNIHLGDRYAILIKQEFSGRKSQEYLNVNVFVSGTLPELAPGSEVTYDNFVDTYKRERPGFLRSYTEREATIRENGEDRKIRMTVDQQIHYIECKNSEFDKSDSVKIRVSRINAQFSTDGNVVRFAAQNSAVDPNDDRTHSNPVAAGVAIASGGNIIESGPCAIGSHLCTLPNMICQPQGQSYTCLCQQGYQPQADPNVPIKFHCVQSSQPYEPQPQQRVDEEEVEQQPIGPGYCTSHSECHQWGECVFNEHRQGKCKCRGWYVGDGVTSCGPPEEPQAAPPQHPQQQHPQQPQQPQQPPTYEHSPSQTVGAVCRSHEECSQLGQCVFNNALGYYKCECRPPYKGDGVQCAAEVQVRPVLILDSESNPNQVKDGCDKIDFCDSNAECIYDFPNYICQCLPGFNGDGKKCEKITLETLFKQMQAESCEIRLSCDVNARCSYDLTRGDSVCQCIDGFEGNGIYCTSQTPNQQQQQQQQQQPQNPIVRPAGDDISGKKECRDQTECHANAHCVLLEPSNRYFCECLPGYRGDGINQCQSNEQCDPSIQNPCPTNSECVYGISEQSYVCKCIQGYTGDGQRCELYVPPLQQQLPPQQYPPPQYPPPPQQPPPQQPRTCDQDSTLCHENAVCEFNIRNSRYECKCKPGAIGNGYSSCIIQSGCYENRSLCDANAQCVPGGDGIYVCNCNYGFHGNGQLCHPDSDQRSDTLLIGRGMSIIQKSTVPELTGRQLVVVPHQVVVDIDYDCTSGRIYWSDISNHVIRSSTVNGTDLNAHFASELKSPEGIAIDWSSRNLYYVDSLKDEIGVVSLDGKYQRALIKEGLSNPRALEIDPIGRKLYYSDWDRKNPRIGRIDLDGKNNEIFVHTDIHLPNGLAIVQSTKELCWVDAGSQKLSCIGLNGQNRRVVYFPLEYPFGLAVRNDERFYWTDWKDHHIHTVSITGQGYISFAPSVGGGGKVYGIVSIPSKCQGTPSPCAVNNGGCEHLCLPGRQDTVSCVCPDNVSGLEGCS
uniref:Nidogen n=1 Tax=Panagrolaimus superbus TaxID=310955 RepID=A0A914XZB2_9BILA